MRQELLQELLQHQARRQPSPTDVLLLTRRHPCAARRSNRYQGRLCLCGASARGHQAAAQGGERRHVGEPAHCAVARAARHEGAQGLFA